MAQSTQINGSRFSFTSISVEANGKEIPKGIFKSIQYDSTLEPGMVKGNQITPVGRTTGDGASSGSFEMLVSELDDFFKDLTEDGNVPIMSVDFDIVVSYSINDVDTRTDTLRGCRITKIGSSNTQGSDPTTKTCDLSIMRVLLNGIPTYADPST